MQRNQSIITEFILLGFGELQQQQIFLFLVFFVIYILTMAANILTTLLIVTARYLHTPMYFFLGNLSCLEILYSSTLLPKMLANLLTGDKSISLKGCMTQLYFFAFLGSTECYLLSVMSYDRFLAICRPLHYRTRMKNGLCIQLAVGSWINGIVFTSIYLSLILQLSYCGPNEIDHFFCESLPLISLSCSDTRLVRYASIILGFGFTLPPFALNLLFYMYIIAAIKRIPSNTGRQKAFSTCSSHLIVVSVFYGGLLIACFIPKTEETKTPNKILSLLYTVLPPLFNPFVYSLRNKDVKEGLKKLLGRFFLKKE
ncbi:olfactory receptor 1361-like [Rhineura floridana]|uniref:olfactory receptor 1361-like n=1 Tax=Rhineura floridana TaxID=261503 RepID=UPI002AC8319E|nr:olfactory receptor 1361-like [Rhineura floridana]